MSTQPTTAPASAQVQWREVPGFKGYRASFDGDVETMWTDRRSGGGKVGFIAGVLGTEWRPVRSFPSKGYLCFNVPYSASPTGKKLLRGVHQFVCLAFHGKPVGNRTEVCHHPDRNRQNNRADNLRWGSRADNGNDMAVHGTSNRGEKCKAAKMTNTTVTEMRQLRNDGWKLKALAVRYKLSIPTVSDIVNRKTWKHV